ncbi:MAG TPA: hypothetical protein VMP08_21025, partial [Anaerolineae bacterium]|nr:hypothetical protein [Anaerolineae bacterium]
MKNLTRANKYWIGLGAWSGLLLFIAYGASLRLPFMADDLFHLPFVDSHGVFDLWRTAAGLYYFRPVSFTLWKIMEPIFGYHNQVAQHGLNLLLHWGNSLMTAWLAGALWPRSGQFDWRRAYLASTLFLWYPFSYQAVPWIGALVHPLVTSFILASVAAYVRYQTTQRRRWVVVSLVIALLAPFVHENGVLIGPLLVAVELTWPRRSEPLWRRLLVCLLWFVPVLVWWLVSRDVPMSISEQSLALRSIGTILKNATYFAQGAGYPLTWGGNQISQAIGGNDFAVAIGLSAVALGGAALVQWRSHASRRSWLPWIWISASSLPAVLFLPFSYINIAPRMLMLASVGIAWLWTDVLVNILDWKYHAPRWRRLSYALVALLSVVVLLQNYLFIRDRMRLYEMGGKAISQVAEAAEESRAAGRTSIFINLPSWLAPAEPVYALGTEGILLLPAYTPLKNLPQVFTGHRASVGDMRFDTIQTEVPYYVGLREGASDWKTACNSDCRVFVTRYMTDTVEIQPVGEFAKSLDVPRPVAQFDQAVTLLSTDAQHIADGWQVDLI